MFLKIPNKLKEKKFNPLREFPKHCEILKNLFELKLNCSLLFPYSIPSHKDILFQQTKESFVHRFVETCNLISL